MQDKIVYDKKIIATPKNYNEAIKEYETVIKEAPKVNDHPDKSVVVKHKFEIRGETISIADLLAKHGINASHSTKMAEEEKNNSSASLNPM